MQGVTLEFQSSPAPKDGRYRMANSERGIVKVFQSSPAPQSGRYLTPAPN